MALDPAASAEEKPEARLASVAWEVDPEAVPAAVVAQTLVTAASRSRPNPEMAHPAGA
jgi:hypothetical protein